MGDKVDMALDDIIKSSKGSNRGGMRRGGGGRGRGGSRGGRPQGRSGGRGSYRGMSNGGGRSGMMARRWNHDMYQGGGGGGGGGAPRSLASAVAMSGPVKVNVSNLDYAVSDSDIRELFQEFGDMKSAAVHYDRAGRSLGSAQIVFSRYSDAQKAVKQYNGVHLDSRPMKIYIEGEGGASSMMRSGGGGGGGGGGRPMVKRLNNQSRGGRGGRGARGGSRGSGRGGRGSDRPKPKTAEELDAELDSYVSEAKKDTATAK